MTANLNFQHDQSPHTPRRLRRRRLLLRLAAILALVSLACNLPLAIHQPAAGNATARPKPKVSQYYSDLLDENVKSGKWSNGQGLLNIFGYLNRETDAAGVFSGQDVTPGEATGILDEASAYLAANPNAPEKAGLERMLAGLLPDPEKILPYSEQAALGPSDPGGSHTAAPVRPARRDDVSCDALWADGFTTPPGGSPPRCATRSTFSAMGTSFSIFTSVDWLSGSDAAVHTRLLDWAQAAVTKSAGAYAPLALSGLLPTDVVFNELPYRAHADAIPEPGADMAAASLHRGTCTIAIFPAAYRYDDNTFEQKLAHEMFHCFQVNNLTAASSAPYPLKRWWMEGAAVYFSNVVYPHNNIEYSYIPDLDREMSDETLFDMSYDNFLFFQEMGNKFGNSAIIHMLAGFPADGSPTGYIRALNSALAETDDNFFHVFGEDYLSNQVVDTDGGRVPVHPATGPATAMSMEGDAYTTAAVQSFQMSWFEVGYPEHFKMNQSLIMSVPGLMKPVSAAPVILGSGDESGFDDLPGEVDTSCGTKQYLVLVTNDTDNMDLNATVGITHSETKDRCEHCLEGTWDINADSLAPYEAHLAPPHVTVNGATAEKFSFSFDGESGEMTETLAHVVVNESMLGASHEVDTQLTVLMGGSMTMSYTDDPSAAPGRGSVSFGPAEGSVTVQATVDGSEGEPSTLTADELGSYGLGHANYVCTEDSLTLTPDITTVPLVFHKSSSTPGAPPADTTPETP